MNGQAPPRLVTYEGILEKMVPRTVQNNPPSGPYPPGLPGQLTHDVFYHPSQYYVELAYLQMLNDAGVSLTTLEALAAPFQPFSGNVNVYCHAVWAGQKPGRGDNSDGKGTNLLWLNTSASENLNNVSPRLQAWQDWVTAGNDMPGGTARPVQPFTVDPIRGNSRLARSCDDQSESTSGFSPSPQRTKALVSRDVTDPEDLLIGGCWGLEPNVLVGDDRGLELSTGISCSLPRAFDARLGLIANPTNSLAHPRACALDPRFARPGSGC